ncbi:MAG: hypothetical protein QXO33_04140 [Nitrososphaeria archaeon]
MSILAIAKEAFEVFMDIRGACGMFMFILEEAIQTAGMGSWILYKEGKKQEAKENEQWIVNVLAQPLKDFANGPAGYLAYPLNIAYSLFADATIKKKEAFMKL